VVTLPTDTEILIARAFEAPKELVYRAYTEPDLVRRWWCGERGEMTVVDIDLRVGGRWRYVMVADGGFEVAFHGEYREIVPNERIVTTEVYEMPDAEPPAPEDEPLNVVTFSEVDGRTTVEILVQTTSTELRDMIINSGMEVGMQESMDRLEQVAISLA
jgi:uncharacterized protein YndB with AHSA1/START domain